MYFHNHFSLAIFRFCTVIGVMETQLLKVHVLLRQAPTSSDSRGGAGDGWEEGKVEEETVKFSGVNRSLLEHGQKKIYRMGGLQNQKEGQ